MKNKDCDHLIALENPEEMDNDGHVYVSTNHKFNWYTFVFNFCPLCGEKLEVKDEN